MIDHKHIGWVLPAHRETVESGRLRLFAKAIGELDPIYLDEDAAQAAGHPALPAPPTFVFCLEMDRRPHCWAEELGVDPARVLHSEQSFTYHAMIYAGNVLDFTSQIADIYQSGDGSLEFIVWVTSVVNQNHQLVAELRSVFLARNN